MEKIDLAIIGGGINGLLIAHEYSKNFPDHLVAIFEKEKYSGEHQSSRNSGVLHAGIYYPKESLKRKLCIEGNKLWRTLAKELNVEINPCGKFVVATSDQECLELEKYYHKAKENEVEGIRWADNSELKKLSEFVHIKKAFFSATTAILDVSASLKSLERVLYNKDIPILFQDEVIDIKKEGEGFLLKTTHEKILAERLINAGGLFAVSNRKKLGLTDLEDEWVKGSYLKINRPYYTQSLIYPVPEKNLKGLGVHTSFDNQLQVRFGPNTEEVDNVDYSLSEQLFDEIVPSVLKVFKCLKKQDFGLDYSGIRSKVRYKNQVLKDFWIKGSSCEMGHRVINYVELCGIDSPGLTSAPAIARYVIEIIKKMNDENSL